MKKFIFTHIPKTAGTTIRNLFRNKVCLGEIPAFRDEHENEDFASYLRAGKIDHQFFLGHIDYSLANLLGPDFAKFCILRNPIDRYISTLKHAIRDKSFLKEMSLKNSEIHQSINFLAANDDFIQINSNSMTRFVATNPRAGNLIRGEITYSEYHREYQNDLDSAITNLNSYQFVGLQEEMNRSVSGICSRVSTVIPPLIPFDNVAGNTYEEISHDTYRIAKEINSNDIRLYQHAMHLFSNYKIPNDLDLIPAISGDAVLDLGDNFSCSGWYPPERVGSTNPPSYRRWATKKAEFRLVVGKSSIYSFDIGGEIPGVISGQKVNILINSEIIGFKLDSSNEKVKISFSINLAPGLHSVMIVSEKSFVPADRNSESKDFRELSLLISSIKIFI